MPECGGGRNRLGVGIGSIASKKHGSLLSAGLHDHSQSSLIFQCCLLSLRDLHTCFGVLISHRLLVLRCKARRFGSSVVLANPFATKFSNWFKGFKTPEDFQNRWLFDVERITG